LAESRHSSRYISRLKAPNTHRKRRRIIALSITGFVIFLAVFFVLFSYTDLIRKPVKDMYSNSGANEWAIFRHDIFHSGSVNPATTLPAGTVTKIFSAGDEMNSSPSVAGNTVYVGSVNGKLYAIDTVSGEKRWEFQTGS
jgi:hypothetical protein